MNGPHLLVSWPRSYVNCHAKRETQISSVSASGPQAPPKSHLRGWWWLPFLSWIPSQPSPLQEHSQTMFHSTQGQNNKSQFPQLPALYSITPRMGSSTIVVILTQVYDHSTMPCARSFLEMVAHQPQCIRLRTTVPGITQPLAGKSEAAPSLDGKEHFKA